MSDIIQCHVLYSTFCCFVVRVTRAFYGADIRTVCLHAHPRSFCARFAFAPLPTFNSFAFLRFNGVERVRCRYAARCGSVVWLVRLRCVLTVIYCVCTTTFILYYAAFVVFVCRCAGRWVDARLTLIRYSGSPWLAFRLAAWRAALFHSPSRIFCWTGCTGAARALLSHSQTASNMYFNATTFGSLVQRRYHLDIVCQVARDDIVRAFVQARLTRIAVRCLR